MARGKGELERVVRADFRGGINPAYGPSAYEDDEWAMLENVVLSRNGRLLPQGPTTTGWATPTYSDFTAILHGWDDRWLVFGTDSAGGTHTAYLSTQNPEDSPGTVTWYDVDNGGTPHDFSGITGPEMVAGTKFLESDTGTASDTYFEIAVAAKEGAVFIANGDDFTDPVIIPPDTYYPNATSEVSMPYSEIVEFWQETLVHAHVRWRKDSATNLSSTNQKWYPNGIWFSEPAEYYTYDPLNVLFVGSAREPIIELIPLKEGLVIVKSDGVWMLQGKPSDYRLAQIQEDRGILGATKWAGAAVWITSRGEVWGTRTGDTRILFDRFSTAVGPDVSLVSVTSDAGMLLVSVDVGASDSWLEDYAGVYMLHPITGRESLSATLVALPYAMSARPVVQTISSGKTSGHYMMLLQKAQAADAGELVKFSPFEPPDVRQTFTVTSPPLSQGAQAVSWESCVVRFVPVTGATVPPQVEGFTAYQGTFHDDDRVLDRTAVFALTEGTGNADVVSYSRTYGGPGELPLAQFEFRLSGMVEVDGIELMFRPSQKWHR